MNDIPTPKGKRGGSRPNSGRKKKYGEETRVLTIRIPASEYPDMKKAIRKLIGKPKLLSQIIDAIESIE